MNRSFPKIENLEYFPLKVLFQIFTNVDDIDLQNLSVHSCRFETIAKMVFNDRYSHNFSSIDRVHLYTYVDIIERFGSGIKAWDTNSFEINCGSQLINYCLEIMKNLKKLKFHVFTKDLH